MTLSSLVRCTCSTKKTFSFSAQRALLFVRFTYPEQDADGTGHADHSDAHHGHLVPGGLSGALGQGGDELLEC